MAHSPRGAASQPCKLFIGGLSYDTTDASLLRYFSRFGQVASAVVLRDPSTSRSRGFGFVTFCTLKAAHAAIACKNHSVDGRKVEAKFAVPRSNSQLKNDAGGSSSPSTKGNKFSSSSASSASSSDHHHHHRNSTSSSSTQDSNNGASEHRSSGPNSTGPNGNSSSSNNPHNGSNKAHSKAHNSNSSPSSAGGSSGNGSPPTDNNGIILNKIFVGGLLYATGHDSLRKFFEQFGAVDTAEVIYNRDTKKSRGFGFVVFQNADSVASVISAQDDKMLVIDGKQVEVKECYARPESNNNSGASSSASSSNGGKDHTTNKQSRSQSVSSQSSFTSSPRAVNATNPVPNKWMEKSLTFVDSVIKPPALTSSPLTMASRGASTGGASSSSDPAHHGHNGVTPASSIAASSSSTTLNHMLAHANTGSSDSFASVPTQFIDPAGVAPSSPFTHAIVTDEADLFKTDSIISRNDPTLDVTSSASSTGSGNKPSVVPEPIGSPIRRSLNGNSFFPEQQMFRATSAPGGVFREFLNGHNNVEEKETFDLRDLKDTLNSSANRIASASFSETGSEVSNIEQYQERGDLGMGMYLPELRMSSSDAGPSVSQSLPSFSLGSPRNSFSSGSSPSPFMSMQQQQQQQPQAPYPTGGMSSSPMPQQQQQQGVGPHQSSLGLKLTRSLDGMSFEALGASHHSSSGGPSAFVSNNNYRPLDFSPKASSHRSVSSPSPHFYDQQAVGSPARLMQSASPQPQQENGYSNRDSSEFYSPHLQGMVAHGGMCSPPRGSMMPAQQGMHTPQPGGHQPPGVPFTHMHMQENSSESANTQHAGPWANFHMFGAPPQQAHHQQVASHHQTAIPSASLGPASPMPHPQQHQNPLYSNFA